MPSVATAMPSRHGLLSKLINIFRRSPTVPPHRWPYDAETLMAVEHLPPYLMKDIGLTDFITHE